MLTRVLALLAGCRMFAHGPRSDGILCVLLVAEALCEASECLRSQYQPYMSLQHSPLECTHLSTLLLF